MEQVLWLLLRIGLSQLHQALIDLISNHFIVVEWRLLLLSNIVLLLVLLLLRLLLLLLLLATGKIRVKHVEHLAFDELVT